MESLSLLLDLKESDYQLWRHQPITKAFLQYLADAAQTYRLEMMARWDQRTLNLADENEMRGMIRTLEELTNLPLFVMQKFYEDRDETKNTT